MTASRSVSALVGALTACFGLASVVGACASYDTLKPPPRRLGSGGSSSTGAGGGDLFPDGGLSSGPPAPDAGDLCGNETHNVVTDPPNIYFVFDTSGSMSAEYQNSGYTRYGLVAHSATLLVQSLGAFIRVGAAVFPKGATEDVPCHVGGEVFPVTLGDTLPTGPTTRTFSAAIDVQPFGGTPTSATLVALKPGLVGLSGKTIVLLATDGGPNCNAAASCGIDQCISNIENVCNIGGNCCASGGPAGPEGCLDRGATLAAAADLAKAGILVYVIGIPGSEVYADLLGDLAKAGGAPQAAAPFYYDVSDLTLLESVFQTIAGAAISCDFTITDPSPDQSRTNVWLDGLELTQDPADGWVWLDGQSKIELVGTACSDLKAGRVRQVQIVSGCPTKVPQ